MHKFIIIYYIWEKFWCPWDSDVLAIRLDRLMKGRPCADLSFARNQASDCTQILYFYGPFLQFFISPKMLCHNHSEYHFGQGCNSKEEDGGEALARHVGQLGCEWSHVSIHSTWKECKHSGKVRISSSSANSLKQTAHSASSIPLPFSNLCLGISSIFEFSSPRTVAPRSWALSRSCALRQSKKFCILRTVDCDTWSELWRSILFWQLTIIQW